MSALGDSAIAARNREALTVAGMKETMRMVERSARTRRVVEEFVSLNGRLPDGMAHADRAEMDTIRVRLES
jgi:hypothetical protein